MGLDRDTTQDAGALPGKWQEQSGVCLWECRKAYAADGGRGESVDVIFLNPPKSGSDKAFLESCLKLAPERITNVFCNPETMRRDVRVPEESIRQRKSAR